jgi:hypothetical protein
MAATEKPVDLSEFLEAEINRNQRAARTSWIVGGTLIVLVMSYLSWSTNALKEILQPKAAATVIAQQATGNLRHMLAQTPDVLKQVEAYLAEHAPIFADLVSHEVQASIPQLRRQAEVQLADLHKSVLPYLADQIAWIVKEYVRDNKAELAAFYKTHPSDEFTKRFVKEILDRVTHKVDQKLQEGSKGTDHTFVLAAAMDCLADFEHQLARLATSNTDRLTRVERLERRLFVTCARALDPKAVEDLIQHATRPTSAPSAAPAAVESVAPAAGPASPSAEPSSAPSAEPSAVPSTSPTADPSASPSK